MFEPQTEYGNHRALNPNSVTTVVAPGATELHLVELLSQLRQLNSGELELTTTLQQHYGHEPFRGTHSFHRAGFIVYHLWIGVGW